MKKCTKCNHELETEIRFCPSCGQAVEDEQGLKNVLMKDMSHMGKAISGKVQELATEENMQTLQDNAKDMANKASKAIKDVNMDNVADKAEEAKGKFMQLSNKAKAMVCVAVILLISFFMFGSSDEDEIEDISIDTWNMMVNMTTNPNDVTERDLAKFADNFVESERGEIIASMGNLTTAIASGHASHKGPQDEKNPSILKINISEKGDFATVFICNKRDKDEAMEYAKKYNKALPQKVKTWYFKKTSDGWKGTNSLY